MSGAIIDLSGRAGSLLDDGKGMVVAVIIYCGGENMLRFIFPDNVPTEEGAAILRKFKCLPDCAYVDGTKP